MGVWEWQVARGGRCGLRAVLARCRVRCSPASPLHSTPPPHTQQLSERHGDKTAAYAFYTAPNGWPLRFHMLGVNVLTGGWGVGWGRGRVHRQGGVWCGAV